MLEKCFFLLSARETREAGRPGWARAEHVYPDATPVELLNPTPRELRTAALVAL
jgi:hypothetical protein